jgi:predicted phosphoribosyltransferase
MLPIATIALTVTELLMLAIALGKLSTGERLARETGASHSALLVKMRPTLTWRTITDG